MLSAKRCTSCIRITLIYHLSGTSIILLSYSPAITPAANPFSLCNHTARDPRYPFTNPRQPAPINSPKKLPQNSRSAEKPNLQKCQARRNTDAPCSIRHLTRSSFQFRHATSGVPFHCTINRRKRSGDKPETSWGWKRGLWYRGSRSRWSCQELQHSVGP